MKTFNQLTIGKILFYWCLLVSSHFTHATIISLESSVTSVHPGEDFVIELWLRDAGSEALGSFEFDIGYDPSLVQFEQLTFASLLGGGIDSFQDTIVSLGNINIAEWSLLSNLELFNLQSDGVDLKDFKLANLIFSAFAVGNSNFSVSFDAFSGGLYSANGDFLDFTSATPQLQTDIQNMPTNQVSEPHSLGLFMGLFCVLLVSRFTRSQQKGA